MRVWPAAPPGEAGHPRARRQERQRRLRRRRPREGRGDRAVRACSTTPARTAAPGRASSSSARAFDRFLELLEPAVLGVRVEDPTLDTAEMGPLITAAAHASGGILRRRRRAGGVPRHGARRPGLLVPADGPGAGRRRRRSCSEEIFGPVVVVDAVRRRGRRDPPRQRHRSTGCPGRSGRATSAAALRVARGIEAGNLSVNSHSSVRYWTPFGGFKKSGLGRELGPDALDAFTEIKNVFISPRKARPPSRPDEEYTCSDSRAASPSSPAAAAASAWPRPDAWPPRARRSSSST